MEYLVILPDRGDAEDLAAQLEEDPRFEGVRLVREALAGEDDAEDHEWAIHLSPTQDALEQPALADELRCLAERFDGWLDVL